MGNIRLSQVTDEDVRADVMVRLKFTREMHESRFISGDQQQVIPAAPKDPRILGPDSAGSTGDNGKRIQFHVVHQRESKGGRGVRKTTLT